MHNGMAVTGSFRLFWRYSHDLGNLNNLFTTPAMWAGYESYPHKKLDLLPKGKFQETQLNMFHCSPWILWGSLQVCGHPKIRPLRFPGWNPEFNFIVPIPKTSRQKVLDKARENKSTSISSVPHSSITVGKKHWRQITVTWLADENLFQISHALIPII